MIKLPYMGSLLNKYIKNTANKANNGSSNNRKNNSSSSSLNK